MTRRTFFALSAAGSVTLLNAQQSASQKRGREILDKVIQALGGEAFRNLPGRVETGRAYSFYNEQLSGLDLARVYTKYVPDLPGPVHEVQRQVFGKKQDVAIIFNDKGGWELTYRGAKPQPEARIKQFQDSALHDTFYILRMRLNEPGFGVESRGSEVVENQPTETLEFFDAENRTVTVWVHADTYLPIKQRFLRWDSNINDRREEVTRFSKYRDVGNGVMLPYDTQRERDGEKIFEMYADQVKPGVDLAMSMFELPPGIKIITKK